MSKEELLKYLIAEIDLIMHDKDYRFENEDGTWYSRESCRDLTNKEVFEELRTELRQLADLEEQLAESEKALEAKESVNRMYKATLNLKDSDFSDLVRENAKLKQQLAEKEKEITQRLVIQEKDYEQDKISFAVEQLARAKEYIKKSLEDMWNGNAEMTCRDRNIIDGVYNELDEQIEELKKGDEVVWKMNQ